MNYIDSRNQQFFDILEIPYQFIRYQYLVLFLWVQTQGVVFVPRNMGSTVVYYKKDGLEYLDTSKRNYQRAHACVQFQIEWASGVSQKDFFSLSFVLVKTVYRKHIRLNMSSLNQVNQEDTEKTLVLHCSLFLSYFQ